MTVEDEYSDGEKSRKREVIPHSGTHTPTKMCAQGGVGVRSRLQKIFDSSTFRSAAEKNATKENKCEKD